jgi:hypothetical protein
MLSALGGSGRLAFGALIGAAIAALLAHASTAERPRGLEPADGGEIVVVRGSEQPIRTATATGTTSSSRSGSSSTNTPTTTSSSSGTTTTTTTTTGVTTTSNVTTTTTTRPTTTTTRRPTTTTTTTTTRRPCGIIFC